MSTSASEPFPTVPASSASLDAEALRIGHKLREVGRALDARYLDKGELIRLLLVTLVAGEHMLIVGPPGTAKSALVRHLARLIDARYFEYLLTRFSEPNEIFGPIDIKAFREGTYLRRVEAMLPDADIVFLDEIFKSNSAILNALLSILNERRFFTGAASIKVPLSSLFGATNEVPNDDARTSTAFTFTASSSGACVARSRRCRRRASPRCDRSSRWPRSARCSDGWRSSCTFPRSSWRATRRSASRSAPRG